MADKIMKMSKREQIIDVLEGGLVVTKITEDFGEDTAIICEFVKNGNKGFFRYFWGEQIGIDYVRDYNEGDNEDIEDDVHRWAENHFEYKSSISLKHDGKELIK